MAKPVIACSWNAAENDSTGDVVGNGVKIVKYKVVLVEIKCYCLVHACAGHCAVNLINDERSLQQVNCVLDTGRAG